MAGIDFPDCISPDPALSFHGAGRDYDAFRKNAAFTPVFDGGQGWDLPPPHFTVPLGLLATVTLKMLSLSWH